MTYNVFGGTLNLAQSTHRGALGSTIFVPPCLTGRQLATGCTIGSANRAKNVFQIQNKVNITPKKLYK